MYWKTESLLLTADTKHQLQHRPRPAPIAVKTPIKAKRDTAAALLPSPTTWASASTSARPRRPPLRLSKRRKQPEPAEVHPLDDATRKTMAMLATRLSGRSSGSSVGGHGSATPVPRAATRASASAGDVGGKGKGRQLDHGPYPASFHGFLLQYG